VAREWRTDLEIRPVVVDVALSAPDPVAALAAEVARELGHRPVVLADGYAPYYRTEALATRFAVRSCGTCVLVGPLDVGE
jgi:hypothetical protein